LTLYNLLVIEIQAPPFSRNYRPAAQRAFFDAVRYSGSCLLAENKISRAGIYAGRKKKRLFNSERVAQLAADLLFNPLTAEVRPMVLKNLAEDIVKMGTLTHGMAALMAFLPYDQIRSLVDPLVGPANLTNYDFSINIADLYPNCSESEKRLKESLTNQETVAVFEGLIYKNNKMRVAFCYQPVTNGRTTFVPGFWYRPVEDTVKDQLDMAILSRESNLSPLQSSWLLTRPGHGDILDFIRSFHIRRAATVAI
jgi:hypothetical protein